MLVSEHTIIAIGALYIFAAFESFSFDSSLFTTNNLTQFGGQPYRGYIGRSEHVCCSITLKIESDSANEAADSWSTLYAAPF